MDLGTPTGIRRLGLSRKRTSSVIGSPSLLSSSPASKTTPLKSLDLDQEKSVENEINSTPTPSKVSCHTASRLGFSKSSEIEPESKRKQYLADLEARLASVQDISELEIDIAMWRSACKESLIDLQAAVAKENDTQMSCKNIAKRLGIWSVIKEQFSGDSEVIDEDEEST